METGENIYDFSYLLFISFWLDHWVSPTILKCTKDPGEVLSPMSSTLSLGHYFCSMLAALFL